MERTYADQDCLRVRAGNKSATRTTFPCECVGYLTILLLLVLAAVAKATLIFTFFVHNFKGSMLALTYEGVLMTNLNKVVTSLRDEYSRLEKEMERVGKALAALGSLSGAKPKRVKRFLSKDARRRIAEAQKLRWAKVRKAKLAKSQ